MKLNIYIIAAIAVSSFLVSCRDNKNSWKEEKTDSLAQVLQKCEMMLEQDKNEIRERIKTIEHSSRIILNYSTEKFTFEFGKDMEEYQTLAKVYKRFLENEPIYRDELNALKKQLLALKKNTDSGQMTDAEFKEAIKRERNDILKLFEFCINNADVINRVEPFYIRVSPHMKEFSDSLEKIITKGQR